MKVAHFCDSEPARADGVSASAGLSVELLRAAGHQVSHYHPGRLRSVVIPRRQIRLAAPWVTGDPGDPAEIVHVHTAGPVGMAGFRLAAARGLPLVFTWHTDLVGFADHFLEIPIGAAYCAARLGLGWRPGEYLELAERAGRRRARLLALGRGFAERTSLFIAPSRKTAQALTEFGALPPVWTIPTPVTMPPGSAALPELDVPAGAPVVLSVGRVTPEKNPELLLRAFARVVEGRPDARLVMLGADQRRRRVLALARALGLTDRVRLVAPVPREQVEGYYRRADVLAFAATSDTQSLVLAEAEAAGLPVVLADAGLRERPGDPQSIRVTCEPTAESLGAGLLRMLDDHDLRERTSRAGLTAAAAYPPERYLERLLGAYRLAQSAGTRAGSSAGGIRQ
jgi:1,2-diacylglycerol 3-alpha-glucosyltransferase